MKRSLQKLATLMTVMVLLTASLNAQTYCVAGGGCDEHISNVTVGTINNSSGCTSGGYHDYTTISTLMVPGQSYPITVTNGNPYSSDQCGIWVDWNQNGNFLDDAPITVVGTPGGGPYTATITVPGTALPGSTRMRVRILYTGTVDPCGSTTYGEVEDYTITIPASNPVDAGITAITQPTSPTQPGLKPISVVLMNYGTTALTSVNLNYSVNGVLATPYLWTGNLASFNTNTVQIGTENLGLGTYEIKAWSSMPNGQVDSSNLNDTATISVVVTNVLTYTLGTGTITNTTTSYPSAYGQYYTGERAQYLLLASELTAIGASGGNILSLAFDVVTPTTATALGANLNGFNIRMGTTTATSLSTWLPTTTQLYTVSQYVTTVGWNTHTFTTPFFWDGVSNLVIETCFDNYVTQYDYTTNAVVRQTATPFSSVLNFRSDGGGVCSSTTVSGTYTQRPNMRLTFAPNLPNDAGIAAITSPSSPLLPGNANMKVNLRNYGTNPLTSVTIGWSVNGVAQTAYSWTGNLLSSTVDTGIVLGNYTFPLGIHTVKAWTSMPNNVVDSAEFNDTATITLIVCNLLTGTYTVGDTSADYPDIQTAVNAAAACGIAGPVIFNVLPGTYNEQVNIPPIPGTSSTNRVTIQSSTGNAADVIIANATVTGGNFTIRLNGADYIDLLNMTIQANDPLNARVIEISGGAEFNVIAGCTIFSNPLARSSSNSAGIYSTANSLENYNIISGNTILNGYYGIHFFGLTSAAPELGNIIADNIVQDFFYYGIYAYYQSNLWINGNTVENHTSSTTVYSIYMGYCNDGGQVLKNRVNARASSGNYALYMYYCSGTLLEPGLVANNFFSQSGVSTGTAYGMYVYYCDYQHFYHNSIYLASGSTTSRCAYYYYGGNHYALNNIYMSAGPGFSTYVVGTPFIATDYNNYFTNGSVFGYWGSNVSNLAALQTASGMETNSVSIDPEFYSSSQLYPYSFAMDNKGTPVAFVADDIDGKIRSLVTPDIGAVEYSPPMNDAGIKSIDAPASIIGPGLSNVSATIKNYGLANLTSASIFWQVNGGTISSQLWAGNLSPGMEDGPIGLGSYSFGYGTHTVKVWTSNPNLVADENHINDTLIKTVYVCDIFSGNYTIGDTSLGADYPSFAAALQDIMSCGVGGPVTFNVQPGIYNEQVTIIPIPGVSPLNTVTFQSSTGVASDVTLMYGAVGTVDNWVVRLDGADYITIQNMTIKTASSTGTYGRVIELINGADYNTISGNFIESMPASTSSSAVGIYSGSTKDEYNIFAGNTINGGYYGIYLYAPTGAQEMGNIIAGNTIDNSHYYGIYAGYQNAPIITENIVTTKAAVSTGYGIYTYYCINGMIITKNQINVRATTYVYALYVYYCSGTAVEMGLIANNFISQTTTAGLSGIYGLYNYYSTYQSFYHNSVNILGNYASGYAWYHTGSTTANCEYVNNMFVNVGGGYAAYVPSSSLAGITVMDYNNYFSTGVNLAFMGSAQTTLAGIQNATLTNYNSISSNPLYYTPTVLIPSSSAVNNLGVPIPIVPDDIFGNLRNVLTPDIGAAEFSPLTNDMAIIGWVSPVEGACSLSSSETVTIRLYNNGIVQMSGIQARYSVNGGVTYSNFETIPLTFLPGDTFNFTFNQTADMSAVGTYNCIASIFVMGDQNAINDTIVKTITTSASIDTFPLVENIETFVVGFPGTFLNGWENTPVTGFRWEVRSGPTSSTLTGPNVDHTLGTAAGKYIHTEASSGVAGDVAYVTSPCLNMSNMTAPELVFWYHMYGADITGLHIDVRVGGVWNLGIFSLTGPQQFSNTAPWLEAKVPLVNYKAADKVRFRVIRGNSFDGDVAVDDIKIQEAPNYEAQLLGFTGPLGGCDLGMEQVSMKIVNRGALSITSNLTASYQVVGAALPVTENVTTAILPGDTLLFNFATPVNLTVLSDSVFNINGWINLLGDPDPSNDSASWSVTSLASPPAPVVANVTIPYGGSANVAVINPDTNTIYFWYDAPAATTPIDTGVSHTTPPLYNTTVYYVDAMYGDGFTAVTMGPGTGTTYQLPTNPFYNYSWTSCIYLASELNSSGTIYFLSYYVTNSISFLQLDQRIYMNHTTASTVSSTAYPGTTGRTLVYHDDITWVGIGWHTIALTTPFQYNGVDNLEIYWENWDGAYTSPYPSFSVTPTTVNMAVYAYADGSTPPALTGYLTLNRPDIKLEGGSNGCYSPRVPDTVFVGAPVVTVSLGADKSICQGDTTQLNAVVSGGVAPYTYAWSPAASLNNASIPNPLAFPQVNTTYSVTVTDQNSDNGTDDIIVTVKPKPNVVFPALPSVYDNTPAFPLTGGTPAGGTYSGPGVTGGIFNPAVAGVGSHTITYSYTDPVSGCTGSATSVQQVTPWVGIGEVDAGQGLAIWPNPSAGMVMLTVKAKDASMQLEVLDVQGKVVMDRRLINASGRHELDLTALPQGVYHIRLTGDTETYLQKLILH